jgi:hypothetical protein
LCSLRSHVLDGLLDGAADARPALLLVPEDLVDELVLLLRGRGSGGLEMAGELDVHGVVDF